MPYNAILAHRNGGVLGLMLATIRGLSRGDLPQTGGQTERLW